MMGLSYYQPSYQPFGGTPMSALTAALEQLDRAIASVDQALTKRVQALNAQCETEREKNRKVSTELNNTIAQLETYLQRTGTGN